MDDVGGSSLNIFITNHKYIFWILWLENECPLTKILHSTGNNVFGTDCYVSKYRFLCKQIKPRLIYHRNEYLLHDRYACVVAYEAIWIVQNKNIFYKILFIQKYLRPTGIVVHFFLSLQRCNRQIKIVGRCGKYIYIWRLIPWIFSTLIFTYQG